LTPQDTTRRGFLRQDVIGGHLWIGAPRLDLQDKPDIAERGRCIDQRAPAEIRHGDLTRPIRYPKRRQEEDAERE
jgi:hypothetical protein